jgi:hypothetical protein
VLIAVGAALLAYEPPAGPSEHNNPSFYFGENVLLHQLYGSSTGDSVAVCRSATEHPADPPVGFDRDEAIAGCGYEEYRLDN